MTGFAYRFPLNFVFAIFDLIFCDGVDAIYSISMLILKKNKNKILQLENLESIVDFLKLKAFIVFDSPLELIETYLQYKDQVLGLDFKYDEYNVKTELNLHGLHLWLKIFPNLLGIQLMF